MMEVKTLALTGLEMDATLIKVTKVRKTIKINMKCVWFTQKNMLLTTCTLQNISGVKRCMLAALINRGVVTRTTLELNHRLVFHIYIYQWYINSYFYQ